MNKKIIPLFMLSLVSCNLMAVSERMVWGKSRLFSLTDAKAFGKTSIQTAVPMSQNYQLKPVESSSGVELGAVRYQIYYKDIPIWGRQLILHKEKDKGDFFTGADILEIEKDIHSLEGKRSAEEVEKKILATIHDSIIYKNTEKVIYIDTNKKAHLAYHLKIYTNNPDTFVASPNYIIDADSGEKLKQWDDLNHKRIGQGLGGNVFVLPYRGGLFQHGNSQPDIPALGKFDVRVSGSTCYVETSEIKVINTEQTDIDKGSFPILSVVEFFKRPPVFSYPCNERTNYVNRNDGGSAPANFSFSAINDAMYFAGVTLDMYKKQYGVAKPLGDDLPLRAYTHIKHFDNAFAVPSIKIKGIYIMHQQIVIGDGDTLLTAPAQGTLAHELSHNFTRLHSNLVYSGHSGGINESFSDMASIAMQDYLRQDFPWYWDGHDWSIGREAMIGSKAIRYMDNPTLDGESIDNANAYNDDINVHHSSGVFNKAFYLLANKPGWSVKKAFQVMVDANIKYWTPETHFDPAACGVIQAAADRKYDKGKVIEAFAAVGVTCPLKSLTG